MANVEWSTTQIAGTILASYSVPDALLMASTHKLNKLNYNQYMNADVVFRIEAAPIQFQAGRLWLCFEPYRNQRGGRKTESGFGYAPKFTTLAGVSYDPSKPAPVEFRVPFQSIVSSWDLPMGQFGCGSVSVYVLSPLNSASSTNSVTLSIQAWFSAVDLRVPTQVGLSTAAARMKLDAPSGVPEKFQSAESKSADKHVFSRALTRISRVATMLGNFPILSSVAGPVAAFTNIAARTAAFFGFAKPPDVSAPTKLIQHNRAAWANADGPLPLVKLATCIDNEIDQSASYLPNPIDEMDISYIVSNPCMLNAWTWNTTDTVGTLITVLPVHPGLAEKLTEGTRTFGTYATTPLGYVASMFKYWAGSMKFKMEAVATPFHAGRLMIAYIPDYDPLNTSSLSIQDAGDNYSVLWDITESTHIEFEVPYLGNTPFLQVFLDDQAYTGLKNGEETGVQVRDRARKIQNGAIVVYVLNQLVAPSTAAASIAVLNWVSGGKDMTFAEPVTGVYRPTYGTTSRIDYCNKWYDGSDMSASPYPVAPTKSIQLDEPEIDEVDHPQEFQSAPSNLTTPGIDPTSTSTNQRQGASNFIPMTYIDPQSRARLAFGEVITNLRVLTRRLSPAYVLYPQDVVLAGAWKGSVVPPTNLNVLCFDPDYFGTMDGSTDDCIYNRQIAPVRVGNNNWLTELDTPLNYISCLYTFARGSRVYGIQSNPSNEINASAFATLPDEDSPTSTSGKGTFEFRLTAMNENDSPPRQPYFRAEDNMLGYNYANTSNATLSATNYIYGLNSALSGNYAIQKSGEAGCGLVVQVPPTSNYPFKLVMTPSTTEAYTIISNKYTAPRSRRFLELRYRPFSSTLSGGTSTYTPKIWPMPTTIMEAAADDFTFGGLVPPPFLTKIAKTTVFSNYETGAKLIL